MRKYALRLALLAPLLLGLGGCYTQSLISDRTRTTLEVAERYQATWDRYPKGHREHLTGTLFQITPKAEGGYTLKYKQRRKREHRDFAPLRIGEALYLQIQQGEAYELMRIVTRGDEVDLFEPLPGCQLKNGDDRHPDISHFKLNAQCISAVGVPTAELTMEGEIGRVLFQNAPDKALAFLARHGDKFYANKRLTIQKK